jgi:hypothetical protein
LLVWDLYGLWSELGGLAWVVGREAGGLATFANRQAALAFKSAAPGWIVGYRWGSFVFGV